MGVQLGCGETPVQLADAKGISKQAVSNTVFSSSRGYYDSPFNLAVSCATPGATITYTVDGSVPSKDNGILGEVDQPVSILVSETKMIRAVAMKEGLLETGVDTHTYLFPEKILKRQRVEGDPENIDFEMDRSVASSAPERFHQMKESLTLIPSVSLLVPNGALFGPKGIYTNAKKHGEDWEKKASFEWIPAHAKEQGKQVDCGVQIQGASSREVSRKHGFRLSFKSQFGAKKLKGRFFSDSSVKSFDGLILRNPTHDSWAVGNSQWRENGRYVNDIWAAQTQRLMGHLSPQHRWVHLFLNGLYWGIYDLCERPDEHFAATHLGGDSSQYDVFNAGRLRNGTQDQYKRALALAQSPQASTREGYEEIEQLVAMEALIDYFLYNVYAGNIDWPEKNHWLIGTRSDSPKFRFINWDAEIVFFEKWDHPRNPENQSALDFNHLTEHNAFMMATHGAGYFFLRLKKNPEFRLHLADRLQCHTQEGGLLSPRSAAARYRTLIDEVEPLLLLESARWGDLYTEETYGPQTEHWKKLTSETSWLFEEFFPNRSARLKEHFRHAGFIPDLSPPTISNVSRKQVTLSNPNSQGNVYYTIDGSDPRERWTGSPTGSSYERSIPASPKTKVKARVFYEGEWSALAETQVPNKL